MTRGVQVIDIPPEGTPDPRPPNPAQEQKKKTSCAADSPLLRRTPCAAASDAEIPPVMAFDETRAPGLLVHVLPSAVHPGPTAARWC
ncbi:hypothetical protein PsYK624_148920 [Phanerochaete sordida]|uniref:Uncharacterized protein n=1 Tax=Phanerochaete sordida TaxID=48140 RepID=A0A9P3GNC6_9APHY|nr:hypothetical protein PsYK624_148920 [Phanerochaete sordida]